MPAGGMQIEKGKTLVWHEGSTTEATWPSINEGIDKKVNDMMMDFMVSEPNLGKKLMEYEPKYIVFLNYPSIMLKPHVVVDCEITGKVLKYTLRDIGRGRSRSISKSESDLVVPYSDLQQ